MTQVPGKALPGRLSRCYSKHSSEHKACFNISHTVASRKYFQTNQHPNFPGSQIPPQTTLRSLITNFLHTLGNRSARALIYPTQKLAMQDCPHATTNAKASAFLYPSLQLHPPQLRRPLSASPGSEPQNNDDVQLESSTATYSTIRPRRRNSVPGTLTVQPSGDLDLATL
jgi:hypothetical protein